MRKILLAVVLLPLLVYGAVKGYLWYDFKHNVDAFAKKIDPFAQLRYKSITTSLEGRAGLRDVVLTLRNTGDEIHLRSLQFEAPNALYFLNFKRQIDKYGVPKRLGIRLHGLQLPLDAKLFDMLEQMQALQRQQGGLEQETSLDALGCGNVRSFGPRQYRAMGYSDLLADVALNYDYKPSDTTFNVHAEFTFRDMAAVTLDTAFRASVEELKQRGAAGSPPQLLSLQAKYTDAGMNARRNRWCAAQDKLTLPAYLDRHIRMLRERLAAMGIAVDPKVVAAYRKSLGNGGTVQWAMYPGGPIDPAELRLMTPKQIKQALGLQLTLGGEPINDDQIHFVAPKVAQAMEEKPKTEEQELLVSSYRPVPLKTLTSYLGRPVRLRLKSGKTIDGGLVSVARDGVRVRRSLYGGSLTQPVAMAEIARAEIYETRVERRRVEKR